MIKSQLSTVIAIFVIISLSVSTSLLTDDEVQLSGDNREPQELMFFGQDDRLSEAESRLNALSSELSALKKSLRCIQCESNFQDKTPPLRPAAELIISGQLSAAGKSRRLWARQTATSRQANFLLGEPGEPGKSGLDGVPGLDGAPGLDGIPGVDGRNGKDGHDGRDGKAGKDGIDGQPGERGPPGPPGPPGETGRRGRLGPGGKQGLPGPAGVCAYKAKYDCALLSASSSSNQTDILLMAPVMIDQEYRSSSGSQQDTDRSENSGSADQAVVAVNSNPPNEERQVFVNEGEHIQLSCEAFGQPRPDYVWRRLDTTKRSSATILLDPATNLKVTTFRGGQLPLVNVDRLQSGSYECLASNGLPPEASKRINVNVNYAPTIRLSPGPSVYQVDELGSSVFIECIVDANPAPLSYWMFNSDLIMSIPTAQGNGELVGRHHHNSRTQKYIITESTGQLVSGSSYTILTLNITNIGRQDLGLYKCLSKNLIGQSVGYALVESANIMRPDEQQHPKFRELILERSSLWADMVSIEEGWPSYLLERDAAGQGANYSIFGNEHRQRAKMAANSLESKKLVDELLSDLRKITRIADANPSLIGPNIHGKNSTPFSNSKAIPAPTERGQQIEGSDLKLTSGLQDELDDYLCRVEQTLLQSSNRSEVASNSSMEARKSSVWLLDQVGKPVYVGSAHERSINWWSLDAKVQQNNLVLGGQQFYATISNIADRLFEYDSQADLLKGPNEPRMNGSGSRAYELKYPIYGQSHLVYNGCFIYTTLSSIEYDTDDTYNAARKNTRDKKVLSNLAIVMLDLRTNEYSYINWTGNSDLRLLFERQPLELDAEEYKLSRIEICSDENGVWLIIPTLTLERRRVHVIKINSSLFEVPYGRGAKNATTAIEVEYATSMKLDWSMIGQMFIIDGVLYGIKDRHLYSSKLQFAYDLYRCKLLSSEYLNEPHRIFTNHFGNTQMINYHPNEPKRLYTIDNGNLLWCPVKLIKTNPNDI